MGIACVIGLAACGDSTAPTPSWADGIWRTVLVDGKPLPYKGVPVGSTFPYVRPDSLVIFVFDPPLGKHAGDIFPYTTLVFSATTTPTPLICSDQDAFVEVTAAALSVHASTPIPTGSSCQSAFNLTRKGDSLAAVWYGVEIRLVKK